MHGHRIALRTDQWTLGSPWQPGALCPAGLCTVDRCPTDGKQEPSRPPNHATFKLGTAPASMTCRTASCTAKTCLEGAAAYEIEDRWALTHASTQHILLCKHLFFT
jgi:hypothetical protein